MSGPYTTRSKDRRKIRARKRRPVKGSWKSNLLSRQLVCKPPVKGRKT